MPDFAYSDANRAANLTWTAALLDRYIKDPAASLPGTTMGYGGLDDDAKRADLIAYLTTLK